MKVFVGNFFSDQLKKGENKIALKKVQKETGFTYNINKIKGKGKNQHIELWACDVYEAFGIAK